MSNFKSKIICEDCEYRVYHSVLKVSFCTYCDSKIKYLKECPLGITEDDIKKIDDLEREENIKGIMCYN